MIWGGLLPARARPRVLWRNGGGFTSDVAVGPADASHDDFCWRLSMAEIDSPGPFSAWPGVDRTLLVFAGQLRFAINRQPPWTLDSGHASLTFDGEAAVDATPLEPQTVLVNAMCRRGAARARLTMARGWSPSDAAIRLLIARDPVTLQIAGKAATLSRGDALQIDRTICGLARGNHDGERRVFSGKQLIPRIS